MVARTPGARPRILRRIVAALALSSPAFTCASPAPPLSEAPPESAIEREARFEFEHAAMGTRFRLILHAASPEQAERARDAAFREIDRLESLLSDWDPDSELSRVSAASREAAPTPWIPIGPELAGVLRAAKDIAEASDGAFDPTVGPLSRLWRRSRRQQELPPPERRAEALAAVGHAFLELDLDAGSARVRLLRPDMRLDLGGIAKGSTADAVAAILREHGIRRALVDAGGDLLSLGPPPDRDAWTVGLQDPASPASDADPDEALPRWCPLREGALATSGDTYQFVTLDGVRYSHIVDPATGLGCRHRRQVSVTAPTAERADAWASALSVVPLDRALTLARGQPELEARISWIDANGDLQERSTDGFPPVRKSP